MRLTIHTERGSFTSKEMTGSENEKQELKGQLLRGAESPGYFSMETETGYVVIANELMRTAAVVVDGE